jgi:hypothetical protein
MSAGAFGGVGACSRSMSWNDLARIANLSDDEVKNLDADADLCDAVAECFKWFYHLVKALMADWDRGAGLPAPVVQATARGIDVFPGIVCGAWCLGTALLGDSSERYREGWKWLWASLLKRAGYVEGVCVGDREIGWSYPRPVVFAWPAPRPDHSVTLFRASNHPGRFGLSWTSRYEYAEFWLGVESRVNADGGKHRRSIYRRETAPNEVLARASYPQPQYQGRDQWIPDPSGLNDETVAELASPPAAG